MITLTTLITSSVGIGRLSKKKIKKLTAKRIVSITNLLLSLFIFSMMFPYQVSAEEYFCKVYAKDILNHDGDGNIDTMLYSLGCTKIRPGQIIVRVDITEVDDGRFRDLFKNDNDPLGIREE